MTDFLTLQLKCPVCGKSLMNNEYKVDEKPGIKLNIDINNKNGIIFLSSIYGSYNLRCNIPTPVDKVAELTCPECSTKLTGDKICEECGAPMVSFDIEEGGKVCICSRSGCKNHVIEFHEFSEVLKNIYSSHGYKGRYYPEIPHNEKLAEVAGNNEKEKEIIETGSFLQSYCPHCNKSLIENNKIKFKIKNKEQGYAYISPYLNVFSMESTIELHEHELINNIMCPHCEKDLICTEKTCELCGSPVAKITVSARTKMIDFYLCSQKGCKWHGIDKEDINDISL